MGWATSWRGLGGAIRAPSLSLPPPAFFSVSANSRLTLLFLFIPSLPSQQLHSALGDIGNLVAPLNRVSVSQAEKARAQEVRGGEREENCGRHRAGMLLLSLSSSSSSRRRRTEEKENEGGGDGSLASKLEQKSALLPIRAPFPASLSSSLSSARALRVHLEWREEAETSTEPRRRRQCFCSLSLSLLAAVCLLFLSSISRASICRQQLRPRTNLSRLQFLAASKELWHALALQFERRKEKVSGLAQRERAAVFRNAHFNLLCFEKKTLLSLLLFSSCNAAS